MSGANLFAYFVLLTWPLVALYLYSRLPLAQATLWTILGGYLLLPTGLEIKFKMIPMIDKVSIPNLTALIGCAIYAKRRPVFIPRFGLAEILLLGVLVGPFITSMLNGDTIRIGNTVLPGVGAYDAGSTTVSTFLFILPFFIGRQYLRGVEDNIQIFRVTVIAALAYSLLMLVEVRMSPQISNWIYGFSPDQIIIEVRQGGFRPVVFLQNGLLMAVFAMTAAVAAAALWRINVRIGRWPPGGITAYLGVILVLCKTFSSLGYGAIAAPLARWGSPRLQLRLACILVTIALTYPMLRIADLIPTTSILEITRDISVGRSESLGTRFSNEDDLLQRAWERRWFGWGRYGRNRVYHGWQGGDSSITDGFWIITLGSFGIVGFLATFGALALSVFRAAAALRYAPNMRDAVCLSALALIVAFNIFDMLPNAPDTPYLWLITGALFGRAEALRAASRQRVQVRRNPGLLVSRPA